MFALLAALSLAVFPADSFHVKVNAPADVMLTVTYQVKPQAAVTRRVKGSAQFQVPAGELRLTVASENQTRDFHVEVRGPGGRIVGNGWGACVVQIEANRNRIFITADLPGTCRSKPSATRG
jgi:hypothetical protein